jgi:stress-induced morphogen
LANILEASQLNVNDISGGCGSMYAIEITSPKFRGISLLKQHRMVSDVLSEEIKTMHGIQIKTFAPK